MDAIVKVDTSVKPKKPPGRKKTVVEPMKIIITNTPIILTFD